MKIVCKTSLLNEYSNIAFKAVSNRTTLPILECVLLIADDDGFRIVANDLEIGIETNQIEAQIIKNGKVALDAKIYMDIIKRLPGEEVTIETDEKNITLIKSNKTEFKIFGHDGEEFPLLPAIQKETEYTVNAGLLKNMIKQTIFAVSTDEYRAAMTGEQFIIKDGTLKLAAVDGFRLAIREENLLQEKEKIEVIIPAKTLGEVFKILPSDEETEVYVYATEKHVLFELSECRIISRLIEGEFIQYEHFFGNENKTIVIADRGLLINGLERAVLISRVSLKATMVKLKIENEKIEIAAKTETGVFYDEVEAEVDGVDLEIGFNPKYIIDALKAIEKQYVVIQFSTPLSPCVIQGYENGEIDSSGRYLVTPIRLQS